jgi:RNA polymerase sigma-70 factor (ECF subfamily)
VLADLVTPELLARLRRFVRSRVPTEPDAEDVAQDVLVRLLEKGAGVPPESVASWLFAVARSRIVDRWRDPRARTRVDLADVASIVEADRDDEVVAYLSGCMEPMLASMSEQDRTLLRRVDAEGGSQADLVREMRVSPSTVKSRVQRARRRLRTTLERCCAVEQDRRGSPVAYRRRADRSCPCESSRPPTDREGGDAASPPPRRPRSCRSVPEAISAQRLDLSQTTEVNS